MIKKILSMATASLLLATGLSLMAVPASHAGTPVPVTDNTLYLTAPATGNTAPSTLNSFIGQWSSTVSWSPADTTFRGGVSYTATISMTPNSVPAQYTFTGLASNFFRTFGATSTTITSNSGTAATVVVVFPATTMNITDLALPGLTAPVTGATPVTSITDSQYTGTATWSGSPSTFAGGVIYTAHVTLTPTAPYVAGGGRFTVAGSASVSMTTINMDGTLSFDVAFPSTVLSTTTVTHSAIRITAPVVGAIPATTAGDSASPTQWGRPLAQPIVWSPSDSTFQAGTSYTATLSLITASGYSFGGLAANFFTVSGATSTTAVFSDTTHASVTIAFPALAASSPSTPSDADAAAAAAAAAKAEAAHQQAVQTARTNLLQQIHDKKPVTITDYTASELNVPSATAVARINADVQALQAKTPDQLLTTDVVKSVIQKETVVDQLSTPDTKGTVLPANLVSVGLLDPKYPNKTSLILALRQLGSSSLDSYDKVSAAIAAQQAEIQARKDRFAAALARHIALMNRVKG